MNVNRSRFALLHKTKAQKELFRFEMPKIDPDDLAILSERYIVEGYLGEGTYGLVYRATDRTTGALFAIKKLRLDGFSEGVPATAVREITLLQDLSPHPNIVRLIDVLCNRRRLFLIFELMDEDLRRLITRQASVPRAPSSSTPFSAVSLSLARSITRQVLYALMYCHQSRIVHRDLKPQNILVAHGDDEGRCTVKLADFGLARTFELPVVTYTSEVVTLWYRAPEILLGDQHYSPAVDLWSVGCIIGELLLGKPLFRGENQLDQLQKIFNITGTPTDETWPGVSALAGFSNSGQNIPKFKPRNIAQLFAFTGDDLAGDLIAKLLSPNPKLRPSADDALSHPWLTQPQP